LMILWILKEIINMETNIKVTNIRVTNPRATNIKANDTLEN